MSRLFQYAALLLLSGSAFGAGQRNIIPSHGHDMWDAATGFPGGYVYSISQSADGYIWIGTSKGLLRYGGWTFLSIPVSTLETKAPILNVLADSNDELWATDDHTHLFRFVAGRLAGPISDNGRHRYLATLLNRSRDGRLLFASELQGVVEYNHGSARVLVDPSMMPRSLTAITQTADGTIWIGTRETGVFRVALTQGGPQIEHLTALTSARVNCLLAIGKSSLLIGTDKGLLSLHDGNLWEAESQLGKMEIFALASGREGDVWIGSNGLVFKARASDIDPEGKIRAVDSLRVQGIVTALLEDRDGDLWIGGSEVIERYRASGFTTYSSLAGLPCSNCGAIYADQRDRLWFAPLDGGLFLLSKGSIEPVEAAGLKDDAVYSIAGGADDERAAFGDGDEHGHERGAVHRIQHHGREQWRLCARNGNLRGDGHAGSGSELHDCSDVHSGSGGYAHGDAEHRGQRDGQPANRAAHRHGGRDSVDHHSCAGHAELCGADGCRDKRSDERDGDELRQVRRAVHAMRGETSGRHRPCRECRGARRA